MKVLRIAAGAAALLALAGCGEKPQIASQRKADTEPWTASQTGFSAAGWRSGDQAGWEEQMRVRAQSQNEYVRAAAKPQ